VCSSGFSMGFAFSGLAGQVDAGGFMVRGRSRTADPRSFGMIRRFRNARRIGRQPRHTNGSHLSRLPSNRPVRVVSRTNKRRGGSSVSPDLGAHRQTCSPRLLPLSDLPSQTCPGRERQRIGRHLQSTDAIHSHLPNPSHRVSDVVIRPTRQSGSMKQDGRWCFCATPVLIVKLEPTQTEESILNLWFRRHNYLPSL